VKLESLDFIYMPSPDPAAELDWFATTLGAEIVFAIEAFGTRVAMLRADAGPPFLLAGHLEASARSWCSAWSRWTRLQRNCSRPARP